MSDCHSVMAETSPGDHGDQATATNGQQPGSLPIQEEHFGSHPPGSISNSAVQCISGQYEYVVVLPCD